MRLTLLGMVVMAGIAFIGSVGLGEDLVVLFGTRNTGAAPPKGFSTSHFDTETGKLTVPVFNAVADAPAYYVIAPSGKFLYACNSGSNYKGQTNMGGVSAYAIDPRTAQLTLINDVASGGGDPSYISLDKTGKFVLVANYQGNRTPGEGGTVAVFRVNADGSVGERTGLVQHKGTSVDPARQTQAYAHSIVLDPMNRFAIVDDLGLDKVFVYKFDEKAGTLTANEPAFAGVKAGSGPRHTTFHPNGKIVYVVQEMGCMVTAFHWDGEKGVLEKFQEVSTLPADWKGTSTCAEVRVHPNGKFLYASNRGHDSIAEFGIDPLTFELKLLGTVSSGGKTPRNFEFDPSGRWMVVTNHGSDGAAVFRIDESTGMLSQVGEAVTVAYPFCPRFYSGAR